MIVWSMVSIGIMPNEKIPSSTLFAANATLSLNVDDASLHTLFWIFRHCPGLAPPVSVTVTDVVSGV